MKCCNCRYWVEADKTTREDGCGGCTYTYKNGGSYYPIFLDEECNLIEPYKTLVEQEHKQNK